MTVLSVLRAAYIRQRCSSLQPPLPLPGLYAISWHIGTL